MITAKKLAFEKKNLSSEEYHARLLQKINNVIGVKHIFTTRINYQVVDETTILVDLPLIFIDFNWHSVFNSKVSELKEIGRAHV